MPLLIVCLCVPGRRPPAVVLAPFFVHLEVLFILGYKPQLHKDIQNGVGVEIAKMKKAAGDQKRAAAAAAKTD